jgi:hypothetical protein
MREAIQAFQELLSRDLSWMVQALPPQLVLPSASMVVAAV